MNIIAFGDIHEKTGTLDMIRDELSSADAVIISGDLTQFGGVHEAKEVLEKVYPLNQHIFAQAGNLDDPNVEKHLATLGISLHGNGQMLGNMGIFGCGGGNPSPFNTPNEFSEEDIAEILMQGYEKVKGAPFKVLVPHMPPFNTAVDIVRSGLHVGSRAVRAFIEKFQPDLCITGHIHEAAGEDFIGNTKILNPGPFGDGGWILITLAGKRLEAELRFIA